MAVSDRWRGAACALASTSFWAGNMVIARAFNASISPVSLAFLRWAVAVAAFAPFALKAVWAERALIKASAGRLALTGFLGITLFNTFIYYAGRSTSAANMSLISIIFPIVIVALSRVVYGERIAPRRVAGIAVVILGVLFLLSKGRPAGLLSLDFAAGDLLMLAAAVLFGSYSMFVRARPAGMSLKAFQFATFAFGLALLAPAFVYERVAGAPLKLDLAAAGAVLYVGLGASLAAFLLWNKAIELVGAATAGIVYYSMPAISGLFAFVFLGEPLGVVHAVSFALIIGGIVLAGGSGAKKPAVAAN